MLLQFLVLYGFAGSVILYLGADIFADKYLQMESTKMPLKILAPSVFLVSVASVFKGYFNGRERMKITANSQSVEQIVKAIITVTIVEVLGYISKNNTVIMVCGASFATTFSTFISLFYLYVNFKKVKKSLWIEILSSKMYKKEGIRKIIKEILHVVIPISLSTLLAATNKVIDAFTVVRILKQFIGESEAVKQYGILTGKVETLVALPYAFNIAFATTLIPSISKAIAREEISKARETIKFSIIAAILIGLPCSILMSAFSKQILSLLFPNATEGALMLSLSSFCIILVVLTQTINGALQGLEKFNVSIVAFGIGCISKLILNIILIPIQNIGIYGAIISNLISYLITLVIMSIRLQKYLNMKINIKKYWLKPILATILTTGLVNLLYTNLRLIANEKISFVVSILFSGCLYLLCCIKILSFKEVKEVFTEKRI